MDKNIEQLISSYIEGGISKKDRIIIEDYIKNNPEFSLKIDNIKNIISSLNNTPVMSTSDNFLSKLDAKINNSSYWFTTNLKTTFGFSFILVIVALFIFSNNNNINELKNKNYNLENKYDVAVEKDTLSTSKFNIKAVDYNE